MKTRDHDLLRAWRAGDNDAGDELLMRHFASVYRFFAAKLDGPVEDLAQGTFLACVERRDKLDENLSIRAYLLGIARNSLFQHFRKLRLENRSRALGALPVEELSSPSRVVANREEHRLLLIALRRIPLDFQIALELFYWEEMPIAEIAAVLEIAEGTVKSRLHRGKGMLREHIQGMDESEDLLRSTIDNLEGWARSLRGSLGEQSE
jgi:RNA polymerase sigma-70 factor (ECF subfamily)